ncbi:fungal-specific transcription factor domain-containing protein [Aspergillus ambiguus]|uniref:CeGAL family transcription factor n=1 Tax=Aspergillus ambiguus TaxID=176160 RepID=UPI003CCCD04C
MSSVATPTVSGRNQVATLEKAIDTHKRAIQKLGSRLGLSNADIDATLKEASYKPKPGADEPAKQQHYSIVARPPDSTEEECSRDEISLATGFIGTSSEVTWLREVDKVIDEDKGHLGPELPIATWSYFTDTPIFEPYTARLDPNGLPSTPVARRLFNTYFSQVHETFPIIRKSVFERQFAGFFSNTSIYTGKRFRAVLNMVFAIGALFVQLTDNTSGVDQRNHTLYFERARVLDIEGTGFQRSDLQHIQTEGLAALYLLAIGQVNRSRKRCVNAVQGAIDLGLHLRNLGGSADDVKETRYRVWWSIYVLEHHLSVLTGRPSCIHESGYSTPLPIPFDEDQFIQEDAARLLRSSKDRTSQLTGASSTYKPGEKGDAKYQDCDIRYNDPSNAMYFLQVVLLTAIGRRAATALYGPQAANVPWQTTKYMIQNLLADLNSFLLQVPAIYDFTAVAIATDHPSHKISLAILFYSTKVLVTRPCLFRLKMNAGGDGSQGLDDYGEFCKQQATDCINAACNVIRFFPEPPDGEELYGTTPWWCILHLLMQSGAIFLLELSLKCQHAPDMVDTVTLAATRVYRYLMVLSEHETTPRKALKIYRRLRHTLGADAKDDDRDDDDCSTPRNPASLQGSSSASDPLVQPTPRSSAPGLGQSSDNSGASTSDPHTGTSPSAGTSDSNIYAPYLEFMQNTGFLDLLNSDTIPSWGDILGSCTTQGPSSSEESNDSGHSAGPDPMDQTPG